MQIKTLKMSRELGIYLSGRAPAWRGGDPGFCPTSPKGSKPKAYVVFSVMCIFPHRKTLSKEVFSLEVAVTIEVTLPISGGRQHTLKISTTLNVEAEGSQDNHLSAVV